MGKVKQMLLARRPAGVPKQLGGWVAESMPRPLANLREGLGKLPEAFIDLMSGRTIGKTPVRIRP